MEEGNEQALLCDFRFVCEFNWGFLLSSVGDFCYCEKEELGISATGGNYDESMEMKANGEID